MKRRTFLTYIFRGFGWIMDAREQLQMKIIRPVIPPDPEIVPKPSDDLTIANEVSHYTIGWLVLRFLTNKTFSFICSYTNI